MFQKDGSSTLGGKKDAPLRKSDRRKLRDRTLDVLFIGGGNQNNDSNSDSNSIGYEEWITRAEQLINDAIVAPKGGDVLSRKLKLSSGEHATLFLRTPSDSSAETVPSANGTQTYEDIVKSLPIDWPYQQKTQPILLGWEDAERKVYLIPLLPLLAALPPPISSPPLGYAAAASSSTTGENSAESGNESATNNTQKDNNERKYRIPNIVIHSEVSKFMCRGADLMKSGIRSFPSPWSLRQSKGLVTISVIGNPQPVAIGMVERGMFREYCYSKNGSKNRGAPDSWKEEAANLVGPGKKGIGVTIVNCYGDDLWKNGLPTKGPSGAVKGGVTNPLGGGIYDDGNFGNAGFVDGARVYPILDMSGAEEDDDSESDGEEGNDGNVAGDKSENAATEVLSEHAAAEMTQLNISDKDTGESTTNGNGQDEGVNEKSEEEAKPEPDHNEILQKAFYTSLLILLASKTPLPIPVSTYYAKHILAAVPATGPRLDMKQTTHKKIGSFLIKMESDGVIKLGSSKDGKDRCAFLVGIVKNNPDLLQFKRNWKKDIEASGGDASAMAKDASATQKTKMAVVDLFIVPRHIADGMQLDKDEVMATNAKTDERKGTGFLTKTECRALIESYIEKEELVDPKGKGRVLINGPLCDALYRVSKKNKQPGQQNDEYPTSVKRKDLVEKWLDRMDKGHAVVQMPGSKILSLGRGEAKPVDVEVEFRQGNRKKFLTRIRGMEEYGVDGEALSQDVSHRFACSSSVETCPVGRPALKKGRVELVFQGHLSEELTALLTGDEKMTSHGGVKGGGYNLPKSVINVVLRKGVPARKKR